MIAVESGWSSLLQQQDIGDLTAYFNPPEGNEVFSLPKTIDEEGVNQSHLDFEELFRALGGDGPTTPPPSECDVFLAGQPTVEIPSTVPKQLPTPPTSPSPPEAEKESHVPRHKRPAHKRAEVKRRGKIKTNLDDLRELLPPIHNQRKSESLILFKAAEHCRHLQAERGQHEAEKDRLRAEIAALSAEIDNFQKDLPVMGLHGESVIKQKSMEKMYAEYVQAETKKNWKFWIFSFMMKPLFENFNTTVTTSTVKDFVTSVGQWTSETLGLSNLRSVITKGVLQISRDTQILTKPDDLQQEALQSLSATS